MPTQIQSYNITMIHISVICLLVTSNQSDSVQNPTLYLTSQLHTVYLHCSMIKRNKALWISKYSRTMLGREWTRWSRSKKEGFCYPRLKLQRHFYFWNFLKSLKSPMKCKSWKSWVRWHLTMLCLFGIQKLCLFLFYDP